jgi:ribonuclease HII
VGWCMVDADFDMAFFDGIADSKKLSEKKRNEWAEKVCKVRPCTAIATSEGV